MQQVAEKEEEKAKKKKTDEEIAILKGLVTSLEKNLAVAKRILEPSEIEPTEVLAPPTPEIEQSSASEPQRRK